MDDIRKSFSKLKKDFKHRVGGKKQAPDRAGANTAGEGVGSSASFLQPNLRTAVGGHDGGGSRISADVPRVHSRDPSPHPEPVPADEGCLDDSRREVDVDGKEVTRKYSNLDPGVQGIAGEVPGQEIKRATFPPSPAPISLKQEPDSTRTLSLRLLYLTTHLGDTGAPAVPDHKPRDLGPDEGAEPSAAANENKSSWKSTAFATAKLLLRGVRDAADAFGPLKSVAGGLCFILENCEVWLPPAYTVTTLTGAQRMKGNEQTIESLAQRVKALAESLRSPISEGDVKEQRRRKTLER